MFRESCWISIIPRRENIDLEGLNPNDWTLVQHNTFQQRTGNAKEGRKNRQALEAQFSYRLNKLLS
jgi:hypothetical protein